MDRAIREDRRRVRHGRREQGSSLHYGKHREGTRKVRLQRPPSCKEIPRVACEKRGREGRLVLLRERQKFGFVGRNERLRRLPETELDQEHESCGREGRRILSGKR